MENGTSPSILAYARPWSGGLPATYYPGPEPRAVGSPARGRALALAAVILLILALVCYCRAPRPKSRFEPAEGAAALARRLADRGWSVYYLRGCGYCDKQSALLRGFGRSVQYGPGGALLGGYTKAPPLAFAAIRGFPHWHNTRTGESRAGFQDAAALAKMAA